MRGFQYHPPCGLRFGRIHLRHADNMRERRAVASERETQRGWYSNLPTMTDGGRTISQALLCICRPAGQPPADQQSKLALCKPTNLRLSSRSTYMYGTSSHRILYTIACSSQIINGIAPNERATKIPNDNIPPKIFPPSSFFQQKVDLAPPLLVPSPPLLQQPSGPPGNSPDPKNC